MYELTLEILLGVGFLISFYFGLTEIIKKENKDKWSLWFHSIVAVCCLTYFLGLILFW